DQNAGGEALRVVGEGIALQLEAAITEVAIEFVGAFGGDYQVGPAGLVEVGRRAAVALNARREAGRFGNIVEVKPLLIAVEPVGLLGKPPVFPSEIAGITGAGHEEQVIPAIVIEVDHTDRA